MGHSADCLPSGLGVRRVTESAQMPEKSLKPMASSEALAFVGDETSAVADQKSLRGTEPAAPGLLWKSCGRTARKGDPFVLWPDLFTLCAVA